MTSLETLRIEKPVYGGDGLARQNDGTVVLLPWVLPGECVRPSADGPAQIVEPSSFRVQPRCVHFGVCGGCQYQMAAYGEQLRMKRRILQDTLERAGCPQLPPIEVVPSPEPWGYRNRIRLRVREQDGQLLLGYNERGSQRFLPVRMCPIATPELWHAAETLQRITREQEGTAAWLRASTEVEFACDAGAQQLQVHLLCPGKVPQVRGGLQRVLESLQQAGVPVVSLCASRLHTASGRALEELAAAGKEGLSYRVAGEGFWLQSGSFFQINRFLLPEFVALVTGGRQGELAWDLFSGVGLFTRALARGFTRITAVEANAAAIEELRRGLRRPGDQVVAETTLAFLRKAVVQRERPELVVLDPPRAGLGEEGAALLARLEPDVVVYVSCDPSTLARDLQVLSQTYHVAELHMVDLFPQTYHLETVMVLHRSHSAE